MKYELNPCEACFAKYQNEGLNINDLNNCCYETAAAFKGVNSLDGLRGTDAMKSAQECIRMKLKTMGPFPGGRDYCTKGISPPPIFNQTPHFLPSLLDTAANLQDAQNKCFLACENSGTPYPEQCKENCITDAMAVIPLEQSNNIVNETDKIDQLSQQEIIVGNDTHLLNTVKELESKINSKVILDKELFEPVKEGYCGSCGDSPSNGVMGRPNQYYYTLGNDQPTLIKVKRTYLDGEDIDMEEEVGEGEMIEEGTKENFCCGSSKVRTITSTPSFKELVKKSNEEKQKMLKENKEESYRKQYDTKDDSKGGFCPMWIIAVLVIIFLCIWVFYTLRKSE